MKGTKPDIVALLPHDGLDETSIHYLMGSWALPASSEFGLLDRFRVKEGIVARVGENTVFFFRYSNEEEARSVVPKVIARLSGPDLYSQLVLSDKDYREPKSTRDKFALAVEASYLLMAAGVYESDLSSVLEHMRQQVKEHSTQGIEPSAQKKRDLGDMKIDPHSALQVCARRREPRKAQWMCR